MDLRSLRAPVKLGRAFSRERSVAFRQKIIIVFISALASAVGPFAHADAENPELHLPTQPASHLPAKVLTPPPLTTPQRQPIEYIDASPSNAFEERAGIWPVTHISIEDASVQDAGISEGLNRVPGIEAREQGSPGIFMRGSGAAGRVQEVWNGLNLSSGSGLGPDMLLIPTENLYDIALLKGASSTFQGRDAMGGAIWYRSRELDRPTARGQIGSFGDRSIYVGSPLLPKIENHKAQVTIFNDHTDGNFDYQIPRLGTSGTRARNDLTTDRYTFESDHHFGRYEVRPQAVWARQLGSTPGAVNQPTTAGDTVATSWLGSVNIAQPSKDSLSWNVRPSYLDSRSSSNAFQYSSASHRFLQSIAVADQIGPQFHWQVFSDLYWDGYDTTSNNVSSNYFRQGQDYGLSLLFPIEEDWTLQASARYLANLGQWVSAYVIEKPIQDYRVHVNFSEGEREPGLSDLYQNNSFFAGNPNLQPERSQQVEVGFSRPWKFDPSFWKSFEFGFNVYQMRYMNLIQSITLPGNISSKINSGNALASGLEFNFRHTWDVWSVSAAYITTQSQVGTTNQEILHTPEYQASAEIGYQFGPIIFSVRDTQWGQQLDQDPTLSSPTTLSPWNTVDLLLHTVALSDWTVRAGALDLLNSSRELTLNYPEPQLRYYLSLERRL